MDWLLILQIAGGFIVVVAGIYGFIQFIDWRIERKIREDNFLRRIGSSLRPTVIFDENESVLIDQGAMDMIESIGVSLGETKDLPEEIVVTPKRYLAHPPLLQTLENELVEIVPAKDKGFSWRFKVEYKFYNEDFHGKRRFRMEILL